MTTGNLKQLEGGRAAFAFERVMWVVEQTNHTDKDKEKKKARKYKADSDRLITRIKMNGLGAAMAFVFSKKQSEESYEWLYNDISNWLQQAPSCQALLADHQEEELIRLIVLLPSSDYRVLTMEVLAFCGWLKRFSKGLIQGNNQGD